MTCKKCGGEGAIYWYENQAPLGSGRIWDMQMSDVCPDCVDKGICPKCDGKLDYNEEEGYSKCPKCGFDESKGSD